MATVTHAVEDYLKVIWKLSHRGREDERVPVGDIAAHLRVSAPSVTGMVQKLQGIWPIPRLRISLALTNQLVCTPSRI